MVGLEVDRGLPASEPWSWPISARPSSGQLEAEQATHPRGQVPPSLRKHTRWWPGKQGPAAGASRSGALLSGPGLQSLRQRVPEGRAPRQPEPRFLPPASDIPASRLRAAWTASAVQPRPRPVPCLQRSCPLFREELGPMRKPVQGPSRPGHPPGPPWASSHLLGPFPHL